MLIRGAYSTRNITLDGRIIKSYIPAAPTAARNGSAQKCNWPLYDGPYDWASGWFPYYIPMTGRNNPDKCRDIANEREALAVFPSGTNIWFPHIYNWHSPANRRPKSQSLIYVADGAAFPFARTLIYHLGLSSDWIRTCASFFRQSTQ